MSSFDNITDGYAFAWGIDDVGSKDYFILTGNTKQVVSEQWVITNGYADLTIGLLGCVYWPDISRLRCDAHCGQIFRYTDDPYNVNVDDPVYDFSNDI
jgi:hypothetical protein